jgi:hypothetical protein
MSIASFWSGVVTNDQVCVVPARQGRVLHLERAVCIFERRSGVICHLIVETKDIDEEDISALLSHFEFSPSGIVSQPLSKNQTPNSSIIH